MVFSSVLVGAWAQFAPEDFYAHFPINAHAWIALDGAFNEHLIRDVGGLNLALASLALMALLRPALIAARVVGMLCFGVIFVCLHGVLPLFAGLNLSSDNTLPPAIKALLLSITIG